MTATKRVPLFFLFLWHEKTATSKAIPEKASMPEVSPPAARSSSPMVSKVARLSGEYRFFNVFSP